MDKELLDILDKARANGATATQLQGIVDSYNAKKKSNETDFTSSSNGLSPTKSPSLADISNPVKAFGNPVVNISGVNVQINEVPFPLSVTKEDYVKGLQDRVNSRVVTNDDVSTISKSINVPNEAVTALVDNKRNNFEVIVHNDAKKKFGNVLQESVLRANADLGRNDDFENVLATIESTSAYLSEIDRLYARKSKMEFDKLPKEDLDVPSKFAASPFETGATQSNYQNAFDEIRAKNSIVSNKIKGILANSIKDRMATDTSIPVDQRIDKIVQLVYPKEIVGVEKQKTGRAIKEAASPVLSYIDRLLFDDTKEQVDILNSEKAHITLGVMKQINEQVSYNKALAGSIIENTNERINNNSITEEEIEQSKLQVNKIYSDNEVLKTGYLTDGEVISKYPTLFKEKVVGLLNDYNAKTSGNVDGLEKQDIRLDEYLMNNGVDPKDQKVIDAIEEAKNDNLLKDYSLWGKPLSAVVGVFKEAGKGVLDIVGVRDELDRLSEKKSSELYQTEVGASDEYQLTKTAKFFQNTANLTGQVIGQGLLQYGTMGLGRIAGFSKVAAANTAFWTSGTIASYDGFLKESYDLPISTDAGRVAFAGINAIFQGATEKLFPDVKIFQIPGFKDAVANLASKVGSKELTEKLAIEALDGIKNKVISFGLNYGSNVAKESIEEGVSAAFTGSTKLIIGDPNTNISSIVGDVKNTMIQTALGMGLIAGMGTRADMMREKNMSAKSIIYNSAIYHDEAMDAINIGFKEKLYGERERNSKIQVLSTARDAVDVMQKTEDISGVKLSRSERELYVANLTAESLLNEQKKDIKEPVIVEKIETKIKALQDQRDGILEGQVRIDDNGNFITSPITSNNENENINTIPEGENAEGKDAKSATTKTTTGTSTENKLNDGLVIQSAVIEIGGKQYEGNNHAEAILKAKEAGEDISNVDRQAEGKFKLSDGTIIDRATAKEQFGQDKAELLIPQNEAANQANKDYAKITDAEAEPDILVGEMIDKPGTYNGERGRFHQDGKAVIFKVEGKNKEYELGNIEEIKSSPIADFNISYEQSVVSISDEGNIKVRDTDYLNNFSSPLAAINRDAEGNVVSVNLDTPDGKKRTFRGNIAEDIAYQISLKEINKNNETRSAFEQYINEDAAAQKEINDAGVSEVATQNTTESNAPVSREKITKEVKEETSTVSDVSGGVKHSENIKDKFREQFKSKGIPDEQISGAVALMDARAKSWASEEKGRKPEQWFGRIADVKSGEFETNNIKYQSDGTAIVFHGGTLKGDGNIYLALDKKQSAEYAKHNDGKVHQFLIDKNKIADEQEAREILADLNLDVEDLMFHEIVDERFEDTAISESDKIKMVEELKKRGYEGVKFLDEDVLQQTRMGVDNIFYFDSKALKNKVKYQNGKGALETVKDGRMVIHALESPDFSTMVHEIAHVFESDLTESEQKTIKDFGGSEAFARGFERYLRDGKAPNAELKNLFDKFKQWLTDIYKSLKGSPIEKRVTADIKSIFDRLLTEKPTNEAKAIEVQQPTEVEPDLGNGRTPVTLSGNTETERQSAIDKRKKETKQTPLVSDRDAILEKIGKFNKLSKVQKRQGFNDENKIKVLVDSFNKKHNQKHTVSKLSNGDLEMRGNPTAKKSLGSIIKFTLKGEEKNIVDNAKPLMERSDKTKQVFSDLLEANSLPVARRINGEKMSDIEFDGTIQDIMEGIPSQRAENYLNSLENQIEQDAFDFGNPDKNAPLPALNDVLGVTVEETEQMTPDSIEEWLSKESEFTPEEEILFDNIENLITYYEQEQSEPESGNAEKISATTGTGQESNITEDKQDQGEKPKDTGNTNVANAEVDKPVKVSEKMRSFAASIRKNGITPDFLKIDDGNVKTKGLSAKQVDEFIATTIEKVADLIDAGTKISDAIKQGIADIKNLYDQNNVPVDEAKLTEWFTDLINNQVGVEEDVNEVAKKIKSDEITYIDAIDGKSQEFIDALDEALKGKRAYTFNEEGFRSNVRRQKEYGISKEDIIEGYESVKKLTKRQKELIDEVFGETADTDKAAADLMEAFRQLAKGEKPKKVLKRLAASDVTSLVQALSNALSYKAISNVQLEAMADYIVESIDLNKSEQYLNAMINNSMVDVKQLVRAKLIIKLQEAGNDELATTLVNQMADDAVSSGRATQSLVKAYEILGAKGNAKVRTAFAKKYAESVQEKALKLNTRMAEIISEKEAEIGKLNQRIHNETQKSSSLSKLKDIIANLCGLRNKK